MKCQKSRGPRLGKSVHQLLVVVNFAYDIRFSRMIAHWKDLSKEYNSFTKFHVEILQPQYTPKKHRLGPQNGSGSSVPEKLLKIVNYQNC